eukprot:scaffold330724_cov43-Prasinocladus_malaysianus.AAC.1
MVLLDVLEEDNQAVDPTDTAILPAGCESQLSRPRSVNKLPLGSSIREIGDVLGGPLPLVRGP